MCPSHFSTPKRSNSHPRGHPTIHLSKSFHFTIKRPQTIFASGVVAPPQSASVRGGGIIASAGRLSTGCREIRKPRQHAAQTPHAYRAKASVSKVLLTQRAADIATPGFRHPSRSRPKNGPDKPSGLCRGAARSSRRAGNSFRHRSALNCTMSRRSGSRRGEKSR